MSGTMDTLIQVAVGVGIGLLAYYISLMVLRRKVLVSSEITKNDRLTVDIIDGYMDSGSLAFKSFNTVNPFTKGLFLNMQRAHNRNGGAQFSYSFWMYMSDTTDDAVRGKDILLKGDVRKYNYRYTADRGARESDRRNDIVVKCPRIRFGNTFKDFVIEFNSLDNVLDSVLIGARTDALDTSLRNNIMSMMQNKWFMLTFTFEDSMPINDFENGLVIRMYVNDLLYYTHRKRTTLRQNSGNFYLFPSGEINGCKMGGLKYYNFAIGLDKVKDLFGKGRPMFKDSRKQSRAQLGFGFGLGLNGMTQGEIDPVAGRPAYLSAYNEVNLYNQ